MTKFQGQTKYKSISSRQNFFPNSQTNGSGKAKRKREKKVSVNVLYTDNATFFFVFFFKNNNIVY